LVVGISGISGAGKTFFIDRIKELYAEKVCVISFDDYYKPLHEQQKDGNGVVNFDLPTALYFEQFQEDLLKLIEGHAVMVKKYQFENYNAPEKVEIVSAAPIIVAEGLFLFDLPQIDGLLNCRIFIEAEMDTSLSRRLRRDTTERGIPEERSLYQWQQHVLPSFNAHILPHKNRCDLVVYNQGEATENLNKIKNLIVQKAHPSVLANL